MQNQLRNILLIVSYDGTNFCGWQKQTKNEKETFRTVQGELEKALFKLHKHKIETNGSGRTDSGVHAIGQAVNFFTDIESIEAKNFVPALNSILPKDIRIMSAREVEQNFHARFDAKFRSYRYYIRCSDTIFAHQQPYCWHIRRTPDIKNLNEMAACLSGEMDCTVFSAAGDQSLSKSRFIKKAEFFVEDDCLIFEICANAFLWRMVRSITGTLLDFDKKGFSKKEFQALIESKDRKAAGVTAPPQGLFLWAVDFPEDLTADNSNQN